MKNRNIFIYIVGLLSGLVVIPLIESAIDVVYSWIEYLKIKPSKLVIQGNKELAELQDEEDGEFETNVIGFHYTPEEDDEYYNE